MANSNLEFMSNIERDFGPDYDWDSVPDVDTLPDIFKVTFSEWKYQEPWYRYDSFEKAQERTEYYTQFSNILPASIYVAVENSKFGVGYRERVDSCTIITEFATMQEAEAQVERMKSWHKVIQHTVKIIPQKPSDAVWLDFLKFCRKDILEGRKVFPILGL